jgi:DNA repair protein RadD
MILRPYQEEAVNIGLSEFDKKNFESLMVCPTAFGKSLLCALIPKQIEGNTIILTTSKELLGQNYEKMIGFGGEASIFSASFKQKEFGKSTYATIQTAVKYASEFKRMGYKNCLFDEVHTASRDVGQYRKFIKESGIKKILGLTATPYKLAQRTDFSGNRYTKVEMLTKRGSTRPMFKDIIYLMQVEDIVKQGFWSKLEYELFDWDTGGLVFNSTGAEYTDDSIERFYKNNNIEQRIINRIIDSDSNAILVFVKSIAQAQALAARVPNSACVYSGMPDKERQRIVTQYKAGLIRTVFNVSIFAIGFDYPEISHIIDANPTASLSNVTQRGGRGTRIHLLKEKCIITDLAGNYNRFGKLEDIRFKKNSLGDWNVYSQDRLLSDVDIKHIRPWKSDEWNVYFNFGKYEGQKVTDAPDNYLIWCLKNTNWNSNTNHIREEILRIKRERVK